MIARGLIRLLSLAALAGAGWSVARMLRGSAGPRGARPSVSPDTRDKMVRDRVCNTFLPQNRALESRVGAETHYFCSENCRGRFLRQAGAAEPV